LILVGFLNFDVLFLGFEGLFRDIIINIGRAPEPYNAHRYARTFSGRSILINPGRRLKCFRTAKQFSRTPKTVFGQPHNFPGRRKQFPDAQIIPPDAGNGFRTVKYFSRTPETVSGRLNNERT
jgi:hypothetical protein